MPEPEGSMHSHAANPEPEPVFVTTCVKCQEDIYVGDRAAQDDDGMMHRECWEEWCQEQVFTVDVTHIEDNPHA